MITIQSMRRQTPALSLAALVLVTSLTGLARGADNCPDCEVSDAARAQYDALLHLTAAQQKTAETRHVAYGLPVAPATATHEHLLHQKDYLTWYDHNLLT